MPSMCLLAGNYRTNCDGGPPARTTEGAKASARVRAATPRDGTGVRQGFGPDKGSAKEFVLEQRGSFLSSYSCQTSAVVGSGACGKLQEQEWGRCAERGERQSGTGNPGREGWRALEAALLLRARQTSAERAPGSARPRSLSLLGRTRARSQERRGIRSPQDPAGEDTNHVHTLNISSSPPTQPRECHVYNMDIIVR